LFVRVAVVAMVLSCSAVVPGPAAAQELLNSRVEYAYFPPKSLKFQPIMDRLKSRKVFELLSQFLAPLRLPHKFYLVTTECEKENASPFYSSDIRAVVFCYEFVDLINRLAPAEGETKQGFTHEEVVVGAFVGILLHEVGHAVFYKLDVPVFGREEDAADQISAFIALQFNRDVARTVTRGLAYVWSALGNPKEWAQYSDEHGTPAQRFYNTLCLAYGGEREWFKDLVDKGWLPKERADNCANEYQQVRYAFVKTVLPYIDQDLMKKVQARDWLKAAAPAPGNRKPSPSGRGGPGGPGGPGSGGRQPPGPIGR
jgi:hypothetical protein